MSTRPGAKPVDNDPVIMICDREGPLAASDGAIYIAVVPDPAMLVEARPPGFHGDVVDALVDLVIELAESETDGSGSAGR